MTSTLFSISGFPHFLSFTIKNFVTSLKLTMSEMVSFIGLFFYPKTPSVKQGSITINFLILFLRTKFNNIPN